MNPSAAKRRDGQELPADVGAELVKLIDKGADAAGVRAPPPPQPPPRFRPAAPPSGGLGRGGGRIGGGFRPMGRGGGGAMMMGGGAPLVFDEMGRPLGPVTSFLGPGSGMRPMMGGPGMGAPLLISPSILAVPTNLRYAARPTCWTAFDFIHGPARMLLRRQAWPCCAAGCCVPAILDAVAHRRHCCLQG